jgi:hypothetical protein
MSSITSWTRIEPQGRSEELTSSLAARAYDPLWFLTRQWQLGEFQAEDNGTPVLTRVRGTSARLGRIHLGPLAAETRLEAPRYDPLAFPLEVAVEHRPVPMTDDRHMLPLAIEAGSHFLRMLKAQPLSRRYGRRFIARFSVEIPENISHGAAFRFLRTMAGKALDGRRLAAALRRRGAANLVKDEALTIAAGDRAEVRQTALTWLRWYDNLFSQPEEDEAWIPSRLEYAVSVATRLSEEPEGEVTLTAAEYSDGHLGWNDFDLDAEVNMGTTGDRSFSSFVKTMLPTPVSIRGAPAPRFWEIEDREIAYGLGPAGPGDLGHLLMIEYSSSYGNDWFVVPLELPTGSLTRIDSLVVTDTFGVRTLIEPLAAWWHHWSMWQLDQIRRPGGEGAAFPVSNLFFLPASVATVLEGQALEQVLFMRDEMANLAWAIERRIESPLEAGELRDQQQLAAESAEGPEGAVHAGTPRYVLASSVPENWVPLIPVNDGETQSLLARGAMLQPDGTPKVHHARGEILGLEPRLRIRDEEIPREGIRVDRIRRLTRWMDGSTILWTAYRKHVGRGEGSSGLQFDRLQSRRTEDN